MNTNDEKILDLKKKIEEKKKTIKTTFTPVTNCSFTIDGNRYNIHTMNSQNDLMYVLIKLQVMHVAATELNIDTEYKHDGYLLSEWITDIKAKLEVVSSKTEANKLKAMEGKLTELLSNDKKTELELNDIAANLGL